MNDDGRTDPPLTVDSLADLQAGVLDDDTAARLAEKVRTDPRAGQTMDALDRVRRELAQLGADPSSAPVVDPDTVDRVGSKLRAQHTVERGGLPRPTRLAVAGVGLLAVAAAVWLGTKALMTPEHTAPSRPTTIERITVSLPPKSIPLSDQQILALLDDQLDFGPLTDPRRRTSCLAGLGYPGEARVLGARPIDIDGRQAVLLLLPADTPGAVSALAVAPTCSSVDTGLVVDRIVQRP